MPRVPLTPDNVESCTCLRRRNDPWGSSFDSVSGVGRPHNLGVDGCFFEDIGAFWCVQDENFTRHVIEDSSENGDVHTTLCRSFVRESWHGRFLYEVAVPTCHACAQVILRRRWENSHLTYHPDFWFEGGDGATHFRAQRNETDSLCGFSGQDDVAELAEDDTTCLRCLRLAALAAAGRRESEALRRRYPQMAEATVNEVQTWFRSEGHSHIFLSTSRRSPCGLESISRTGEIFEGVITCPTCLAWLQAGRELEGREPVPHPMVLAEGGWHRVGEDDALLCSSELRAPTESRRRYLLEPGNCPICVRGSAAPYANPPPAHLFRQPGNLVGEIPLYDGPPSPNGSVSFDTETIGPERRRHIAELNRAFNVNAPLQPSRIYMNQRDLDDIRSWTASAEVVPIVETRSETLNEETWNELMAAEARFLEAHGWEIFVLPPGTRDRDDGPPYWSPKHRLGPMDGFATQSQAVSNQKKENLRLGMRVPVPVPAKARVAPTNRFTRLESDDDDS